jgi:hypothetical protein
MMTTIPHRIAARAEESQLSGYVMVSEDVNESVAGELTQKLSAHFELGRPQRYIRRGVELPLAACYQGSKSQASSLPNN